MCHRVLRRARGRRREKGEGISILIPWRTDFGHRETTLQWLIEYWRSRLPRAQIITGRDDYGWPFSKTVAVNEAAGRATGDIFAIVDADCYIDHKVLLRAAGQIREARAGGERLWFVPYRRFYRLTEYYSGRVTRSDPRDPTMTVMPRCPPDSGDVEDTSGSTHGHWFGALIQVMPREAFELVGGMDPRFRGWGSEDVSFMRAVDCLYAPHKSTPNCVFHLWHPKIGTVWPTRRWEGQDEPRTNEHLGMRYRNAMGDRERMRALGSEWQGERDDDERKQLLPKSRGRGRHRRN